MITMVSNHKKILIFNLVCQIVDTIFGSFECVLTYIFMLFFAFSKDYNQSKAHNMLVSMLDPCYKNMKCIQNFMGNSIVVQIVVEYNAKI